MILAARAISVALVLLAAGCASSPEIHYYSLVDFKNKPASGACVVGGARAVSINVQPFSVSAPFDTLNVVYQPPDSPQSVGFYESHRWASQPGWMIAQAVADYLCKAGVNAVLQEPSTDNVPSGATPERNAPSGDITLSAVVTEFLEVDVAAGPTGQIALTLRAVDAVGELLFERAVSGRAPAEERTVESVVQALRQALRLALNQASVEFERVLKGQPEQ